MLDMGALNYALGMPYSLTGSGIRTVSFYMALIPRVTDLAPVCFYGAMLAELLFKLPCKNATVAECLSAPAAKRGSWRRCIAATFAVGWAGLWLMPVLFAYAKTLGWM